MRASLQLLQQSVNPRESTGTFKTSSQPSCKSRGQAMSVPEEPCFGHGKKIFKDGCTNPKNLCYLYQRLR